MHRGAAPPEAVNSDFEELLSIFNENGVRYLIVGGHAVMLYTEPRYTHPDPSCRIDASAENARAGIPVAVGVRRTPGRPVREGLRRGRVVLPDGHSPGVRYLI